MMHVTALELTSTRNQFCCVEPGEILGTLMEVIMVCRLYVAACSICWEGFPLLGMRISSMAC